MAILSTTNAAAVIPEVWSAEVLAARYAGAVISPRVLNRTDLVAKKGDIMHIPVMPRFAGGTVDSDGNFTPEAQTITDVTITIDRWFEVSGDIPDQVDAQAMIDLKSAIAKGFGARLAEDSDTQLANLSDNLTGTAIGSSTDPVQFVDDAILAALLNLARNNIPKAGLSWILPPEAYYLGIFTKDRWTDADKTGFPKSVVTTGFRYPIFDVPAYESTLTQNRGPVGAEASVKGGMLIHKEALGVGFQKNNSYEEARAVSAGRLATIFVAHSLYGTGTVRADHGLEVFIKTTQ